MRGRVRLAGGEELPASATDMASTSLMSRPPKLYSSTDGLETLALADLADGGDAGHHPQIGVDDAGAVAVGAGALGVGTEQRRA